MYEKCVESEQPKTINYLELAAQKYEWCVNTDTFSSKYGKSKHQLWSELCQLLSQNPEVSISF